MCFSLSLFFNVAVVRKLSKSCESNHENITDRIYRDRSRTSQMNMFFHIFIYQQI